MTLTVDGNDVSVDAEGSLLDVLRGLGVRSAKDGCSPQGQCGCCTVWVDGQPRVSCVTPVSRVSGRVVTTLDSLPGREEWAEALCATGGTQCGFCTPGIVMRLAALESGARSHEAVCQSLLAHQCRCTGWNPVLDAVELLEAGGVVPARDLDAASRRASLEGRTPQHVSPGVVLGEAGFAADTAPADALIALVGADGEWVVGESLAAARRLAGKIQGRRTTVPVGWPVELPDGDWDRTLRTTWVDPAPLETDAAWCLPGGEPVGPDGHGGAFGGKAAGASSEVAVAARRLADEHGRPVLALWSREDSVRRGPKRPPLAIGLRADGSGIVRVARTPGIADAIRSVAPLLEIEEVEVAGPPTSAAVRGAGWVEALVALGSLADDPCSWVVSPEGARARATIDDSGVHVEVECGEVLDEVVLRSYCAGAAHMALGWVRSEAICVDQAGEVHDLTMRSLGILRAVDTPRVDVVAVPPRDGGPTDPVNGSDAVFAAVALAAWRAESFTACWPTMRA
ncbi:MAG: (2Fe-2S)-binding protein [Ilumatobacteraceae bacterium]